MADFLLALSVSFARTHFLTLAVRNHKTLQNGKNEPVFFRLQLQWSLVCRAGWAYMFWHQSTAALMLIIINDASLCRLPTKLKPFRCIFILIWPCTGLFSPLRPHIQVSVIKISLKYGLFLVSRVHHALKNLSHHFKRPPSFWHAVCTSDSYICLFFSVLFGKVCNVMSFT